MNPQMAQMMQQFGGQMPGMSPPEPLVKMNAGKMTCKNSTITPGKYTVSPLPEKGQIQVIKDEQGIVHFQWKNRISDSVDPTIDHMVFPGSAKFEKVNTGKEGDRVVMLQFTENTSRRWFFWLQHKKDDDDVELTKKMNDVLNGVSIAAADADADADADAAAASTTAGDAAASASSPSAGAVSMAQVLSALGLPPAPDGTTAAASSSSSASSSSPAAGGAITSEDLMRALGGAAGAARERSTLVPLQDVVTAEEVVADGVLSDEAAQEALLPTLPPGQQTVGELQATVHSPQYQQTLASLTSALQSENYNSIFANFGLDPAAGAEALAQGNGVEAFVAALNAQASDGSGAAATSNDNADAQPGPGAMEEEPKE